MENMKENMNISSLKKTNRVDYIDIYKAFGIILMIIGHVGFGDVFGKWIHFFHMPMFFIVSGYLYHSQGFSTLINKRVRTLLIPYFVFGVLCCCISFARDGQISPHAFFLLFWENTAESGIPMAGALWFLTAMFVAEVLFWPLQRMHLSVTKTTIIAAIIAIAGMSCATYLPIRLPYAIDVGMVGVGLYQIGKIIKEKVSIILQLRCLYYIIGIAIFSFLGLFSPYINLRLGRYGLWPMFWINAVGMSISLLGFSKFVSEIVKRKCQSFSTWLIGVGRESIVYVCLNQLMILEARDIVKVLIPFDGVVVVIIQKLIILLLALAGLYFAQNLIMKTKLRIIVGR